MEVTALRARLADLQEEGCRLKGKIRKEIQEEYEALVQNIFTVCLQLKVGAKMHLNSKYREQHSAAYF